METMTSIMAIERCRRTKANTIRTHIMTTAVHADGGGDAFKLRYSFFFCFFNHHFFSFVAGTHINTNDLKKKKKAWFCIQHSRLYPLPTASFNHPMWHQLAKRQKIRHCCAHIFTETCLHHNITNQVYVEQQDEESWPPCFYIIDAHTQSKWMETWSKF